MEFFNETKAFERITSFISQLPVVTKSDAVSSYISILKKVDATKPDQYLKHIQVFANVYLKYKEKLMTNPKSTQWISENVQIIYKDEIDDEELNIPLSAIYLKTTDLYSRDLLINHMIGIFLVIENDSVSRNTLKLCKQDLNPSKYKEDDKVLDDVINSFMTSMEKDGVDNVDTGGLMPMLRNAFNNPNVEASITKMANNMNEGTFKPESLINLIPKVQSKMESEFKPKTKK